jgi:hypothetical protein
MLWNWEIKTHIITSTWSKKPKLAGWLDLIKKKE